MTDLLILIAALIALPALGKLLRAVMTILSWLLAGAFLFALVIILLVALVSHGLLA